MHESADTPFKDDFVDIAPTWLRVNVGNAVGRERKAETPANEEANKKGNLEEASDETPICHCRDPQ